MTSADHTRRTTERLILDPIGPEHAQEVWTLHQDPVIDLRGSAELLAPHRAVRELYLTPGRTDLSFDDDPRSNTGGP
jgi:hypothetical protein